MFSYFDLASDAFAAERYVISIMNKQSKIGFWGGLSFRRTAVPSRNIADPSLTLSPDFRSPKPRRESNLTTLTTRSGASNGSSVAHENLKRALNSAQHELDLFRRRQAGNVERDVQLDIAKAENQAYKAKVKELTAEVEVLRKGCAVAGIVGDELTSYKTALVDKMVGLKKAQVQAESGKERIAELEAALQSANATISSVKQQVDEATGAGVDVKIEADASAFLYEKLGAVMQDMAIAIKIAVMRRDGTYSELEINRWTTNFLSQLDPLEFPAAVSVVIESVTSQLTELIKPSNFLFDAKLKKILAAANLWYCNEGISDLVRLMEDENAEDGRSPMKSAGCRSPFRVHLNDLYDEFQVTSEFSAGSDLEFRDTAQLLKYFVKIFERGSDAGVEMATFPDVPFPIPDGAELGRREFLETLNILKTAIKNRLTEDGVVSAGTNGADGVDPVREDNERLRAENAELRRLLEFSAENNRLLVQGLESIEEKNQEFMMSARSRLECLSSEAGFGTPDRRLLSDGGVDEPRSPFVLKLSPDSDFQEFYSRNFSDCYPVKFGALGDFGTGLSSPDLRRRIDSWNTRRDQLAVNSVGIVSIPGTPPGMPPGSPMGSEITEASVLDPVASPPQIRRHPALPIKPTLSHHKRSSVGNGLTKTNGFLRKSQGAGKPPGNSVPVSRLIRRSLTDRLTSDDGTPVFQVVIGARRPKSTSAISSDTAHKGKVGSEKKGLNGFK